MHTLPQMLAEVVRRNPQRVAIVEGERTLTYFGLQQRIHTVAGRLRDLGVKPGDAVALLLPNGVDFVSGFFAIAQLGAIVAPLNTHYQQNELIYYINDCRASALVTLGAFETLCRQVLPDLQERCQLLVLDAVDLGEPSELTVDAPADMSRAEGYVIYQYSSGSTGSPKRIARTHANLSFELRSLARTIGVSGDDTFLGAVPFSHVNGLVRSMLTSMSVGATLAPVQEFKRQQVAHTIQQQGVTVWIGVPFMFSILAETTFRQPVDFSSLRLCVSASAPMPAAINRKFRDKYGCYVRQLYGSTETGTISVNMSENVVPSLESVGLPIDGVEIAVFRDDGCRAATDETGEVAVKSPAAISGYDNLPDNEQPFRDGYFLTGDLGKMDRDGLLYLVGRKKFCINKGGYKINPWEIETLLEDHPHVEEVVVIGVPTSYGDERVKAVIVPRGACSEEEIVTYCRGKIADFKVPSLVEFRQQLPKSQTGKILRKQLV